MMPRYVNRHDNKGTLPFEVVDLISASVLLIREMSCDRVKVCWPVPSSVNVPKRFVPLRT